MGNFILFVWLIGSSGKPESGWLPFETDAKCEIRKGALLQQDLKLTGGSKATRWVAECMEVSK